MELNSLTIHDDKDVIAARDRARVICEELGFDVTCQLQVTTAVFELGKNILEHGKGGTISFSLLTDDNTLTLEVQGTDEGPGLSQEELNEILDNGGSTANRGIPAMKRLMDSIDIHSAPGEGTTIHLLKQKPKSAKSLTGNFVSFLQEKFSASSNPTASEELRLQNTNLVQSLSLYEEKNQELKKTNQELLDLKLQLEASNDELQERSLELQEALFTLGDRTTELESQNRRFNAVLKYLSSAVLITDRSGVVTIVSDRFCQMFGLQRDLLLEMSKINFLETLGKQSQLSSGEWIQAVSEMYETTEESRVFDLNPAAEEENPQALQCKVIPILDSNEKFLGRLWLVD